MMSRRVAAVVLAAGASSRLGQPKQLVTLDGELLLDRAIRIAHEAGAAPVFVVLGAEFQRMLQVLEGNPFAPRILINKAWRGGMASSIALGATAAERAGVDDLLILSCDQPAVTPEHLRRLAVTSNREHVVASYYREHRGIPALFPEFAFHALQELTGDSGARELLQDAAVLTVALPGGEFDVDTPKHLEELRRLEAERSPMNERSTAPA